ncbi:tRNA epoxyqueuosine(34) reductase QueG [Leptospira kanakyensis]|uniref:tRNA epoxyqueuosine(34) reductase QueG n=1 Tax=Leptospira kanakyensis TaxID=2484968 RepID=UPI00223DB898|nr:tRNA epoxyqueuosine(34) reductase QueG [Leptospira kanakyensis]MCW7482774.1 tRNA epoxyqueuosine(34) reductase QueG [Leptospira kanakyensis]
MTNPVYQIRFQIKTICEKEGFSLVGFTEAKIPNSDREHLEQWIQEERFGNMHWFAKDHAVGIRNDFQNLGLVPRSVICLGFVYRSTAGEEVVSQLESKVSRYALGSDYHIILKEKGNRILKTLRSEFPNFKFRQSVDSLPVAEKILTKESGIVWQGKNTNLIHPKLGSYFFLSTILTDLELGGPEPEEIITDHCGSCRKCLDICPTGALEEYQIDARKCISYLTIEDRKETEATDSFLKWDRKGWVYGCDLCQEVCPWNANVAKRNKVETLEPEFLPRSFWTDPGFLEKKSLTKEEFDDYFKDSPIERIGFEIWNRNLRQKNEKKSN